VLRRSQRYIQENNVHLLEPDRINENNRLFVDGGARAGYRVEQFPVNVSGCRGSSLCNLGCPNQAKQGTNRVQLPAAERAGVEVVTRAEALRIEPDRGVVVRVREKPHGAKGLPSEWAPGDYRVQAKIVVCAGGALGSTAHAADLRVSTVDVVHDSVKLRCGACSRTYKITVSAFETYRKDA